MVYGVSVYRSFFFFKQKTAYEMRISDWSSACALPISITTQEVFLRSKYKPVCLVAEAVQLYGQINGVRSNGRSEEHTSELQSLMRMSYAVFCLKNKSTNHMPYLPRNKQQSQKTNKA